MKNKSGILLMGIMIFFTGLFVLDTFYDQDANLFNPPIRVYDDVELAFYRYSESDYETTLSVKIYQDTSYTLTLEFKYISTPFELTNISIYKASFFRYDLFEELDIPEDGLVYVIQYPPDDFEPSYRLDIDYAEGDINISIPGTYTYQVITFSDIFNLFFKLVVTPLLGIIVLASALKSISVLDAPFSLLRSDFKKAN